MSAGAKYEYLWADGVKVTKPVRVPAREYVDLLMSWIEDQLNDEKLFPTSSAVPFPATFKATVKNIMKRLFRVYSHIYFHHWESICELKAEAHLNTCFKHFIYFSDAFGVSRRQLHGFARARAGFDASPQQPPLYVSACLALPCSALPCLAMSCSCWRRRRRRRWRT